MRLTKKGLKINNFSLSFAHEVRMNINYYTTDGGMYTKALNMINNINQIDFTKPIRIIAGSSEVMSIELDPLTEKLKILISGSLKD